MEGFRKKHDSHGHLGLLDGRPNGNLNSHFSKYNYSIMVTPPGTALGRFPFEALFEINGHCLELMTKAAFAPTRGMHPLLYQVRELLMELTPAARRRAARSRILMVDLRFNDAGYWMGLASASHRYIGSKGHAFFPRRSAADLSRSTLILAWHALLASTEIASVALGMHRDVAKIIAEIPISNLERIAKNEANELMPRWADLSNVWTELLQAAQENDPLTSRFVALHTLQLAATEQPGAD
jgi:hypothetical protein